jgi:hypothetical protein
MIEGAERILQQPSVSKTSFNQFPKDILRLLCDRWNLKVSPTRKRQRNVPIKPDYINALMSEVEVSPRH